MEMKEETKVCSKCGEEKLLELFRKGNQCKECEREQKKKYREKNRKITPNIENELLRKEGKRRCKTCKDIKLLEEFQPVGGNSLYEDGTPHRRSYCSICHNLSKLKDKDKYFKEQEYIKELHKLHKEGKRRCRHCEEIKLYEDFQSDSSSRVYYNKKTYCKECAKEKWTNEYRRSDDYKKKKAVWDKTYHKKHRSKLNAKQRERYSNDLEFKLKLILRNALNKRLKLNIDKKQSVLILTGATITELKEHLESQFTEGMSWDNHGKKGWHIDHIRPCASFDLTNEEEQKKCFHYTNLQPLWWYDNLTKSDSWDGTTWIDDETYDDIENNNSIEDLFD